jgi:hypothetical protein
MFFMQNKTRRGFNLYGSMNTKAEITQRENKSRMWTDVNFLFSGESKARPE